MRVCDGFEDVPAGLKIGLRMRVDRGVHTDLVAWEVSRRLGNRDKLAWSNTACVLRQVQ